ncbi:disease resistance protein RPM1-like [Hibiscus syriacus]|uniref:disease resistance protein RPM1-like n=1 Tax=Hibiscus syriacus TaxID=106335 RepID=UPI001921497E|nr:disease resistance protein RPM1-like [Hibiscus syriacus]
MAFDCKFGPVVPSNICLLSNLHVLSFVDARGDFIKQLSKMVQLRRLGVTNVKEADEKYLCSAIAKMTHLQSLKVKSCNEDEQVKMDALESAPPDLRKLALVGKLEKVPHWFNSLDNLTSLVLNWSRLRDDFLPHIQALPNLVQLKLLNVYEGERLDFLEGFQKLKVLAIGRCPRLKEILINRGVMPGLQELFIAACQELTTLPDDWESLPDLNEVYLSEVSPELIQKICRSKGMNQQTIRSIQLSREEGIEAIFKITRWFE